MGQFDSFADFLAMGDYGIYVWSAFGATFLCLGTLTWHTLYVRKTLKREALKQLARLERVQAARAKRAAKAPLTNEAATRPGTK